MVGCSFSNNHTRIKNIIAKNYWSEDVIIFLCFTAHPILYLYYTPAQIRWMGKNCDRIISNYSTIVAVTFGFALPITITAVLAK